MGMNQFNANSLEENSSEYGMSAVFMNKPAKWIIHGPISLQRQGSGLRSCSELLREGRNEGFVGRSVRPKGKKCRQ